MKTRLIEVDVLRGLSIFGMILVITPGDWSHRFQWTNHAAWQGYPLSDMIFPSFLFCVGMSMAISFNKKQDQRPYYLFFKVLKRTFLLILLGLIVNGFPNYDLENIRIPGILQRIGLCYFIIANLWLLLKSKKIVKIEYWLAGIAGLILIVYYLLLYHIPIPNMGISGDNSYNSLPVLIDQKVFGVNHLWPYGTTDGKVTYDSEGILATFPASVNVIFGLIIGRFYTRKNDKNTIKLLLISGFLLLMLGMILDQFNIMPSVKKIWTSSFAILSGGFSILVLAFIRILFQFVPKSERLFYPFIIYGSNAILAFMISNMLMNILDKPVIHKSVRQMGFEFFNSFISSKIWSSFMFTLVFLTLLFILLQVLYKKRVFLKV